jgi:hypothetical protein
VTRVNKRRVEGYKSRSDPSLCPRSFVFVSIKIVSSTIPPQSPCSSTLQHRPLPSSTMTSTITIPSFECSCCFDTIDLNHAVTCQSGHVACVSCMEGAMKNAIEENKPFHCFHPDKCEAEFSHIAVMRAIQDQGLKNAYDNLMAHRSTIIFDNTWSCGLCDNVVAIEGIDVNTYDRVKCNACDKTICQKCKKEAHDGPCDEERRKEEAATERLVYKCICGNKFIRGDGCNHMTCNVCRRHSCWICKAVLTPQNLHMHFYSSTVPQRHRPAGSTCPQYGERAEDQQFVQTVVNNTHRVRRRVNVEEVQKEITTLDLSTIPMDLCGAGPEPQAPVVPEKLRRVRRVVKSSRVPCRGVTVKGRPCSFKSENGYCARHAHQGLQALGVAATVAGLVNTILNRA